LKKQEMDGAIFEKQNNGAIFEKQRMDGWRPETALGVFQVFFKICSLPEAF